MTAPLDDVQVVTVETPGAGTPTVITVEVPGVQGPPGTFAFGTVATGAPGTEAFATVSPDTVNPEIDVINLTIPRGDVGPAADLAVGAVESLLSEDTPTVTITGSAPNQVINFGIPRGAKGDKGDEGPQGLQGIQGPPGAPGANGKDGAGISISGEVATYANLPTGLTSADAGRAYIVDADGKLYIWSGTAFPASGSGQTFVGPAGPGNNITMGTITTTTPGSAANATLTGTSPSQVLNLTIPRGADGANGADGVPGPGLASGGAAGDVAMKNSTADFDTKWATPVSTATVNALMKRDAAGRAQVVDPSASADISTKNYVDTQITANKAPNATSSTRGLVTLAQMSPPPSSGTYASRPSATTVLTGTLYYATDTKETYRATGTNGVNATSWTVIPAGGTELDYAERTTDFALPAGTDWLAVTGVSVTITVPERPYQIEVGCLTQYVASTGADTCLRILETNLTGTVIGECHGGYNTNTSDFTSIYFSRRVPTPQPTPGTSKTYILAAVERAGAWTVKGSTTYPCWMRVRSL